MSDGRWNQTPGGNDPVITERVFEGDKTIAQADQQLKRAAGRGVLGAMAGGLGSTSVLFGLGHLAGAMHRFVDPSVDATIGQVYAEQAAQAGQCLIATGMAGGALLGLAAPLRRRR